MCGKSLVARSITLGRKAAVASDPKGEWVAVANAVGGKVISVGPGRPARVNPLDAGPRSSALSEAQWQAVVRQRRRYLLVALVSLMRQGMPLRPVEHTALDMALTETVAENSNPTLPMVLDHLLNPVQGNHRAGWQGRRPGSQPLSPADGVRRLGGNV
jgi:hypothetical protein